MTYRFTESDGSVAQGVQRIAIDQIDKAVAEIDDGDLDAQKTVHQVRKRCKKLRGLIRLVRPTFGGYGRENRIFRNSAKELSHVRDSQVAVETYDNLIACYADQVDTATFSSIRRRLVHRRRQTYVDRDLGRKLAEVRKTMTESRRRVEAWTINAEGFDALAGGLGKTYKRARNVMKCAEDGRESAKLHEWRKRIKYHWYHARLLRDMWTKMVRAHGDAADELAELLGEHHDLAVLRHTLLGEPDAVGDLAALEAFVGLVERRQAVLEVQGFALSRLLQAEKPAAFLHRWGLYWREWTSEIKMREEALAA